MKNEYNQLKYKFNLLAKYPSLASFDFIKRPTKSKKCGKLQSIRNKQINTEKYYEQSFLKYHYF